MTGTSEKHQQALVARSQEGGVNMWEEIRKTDGSQIVHGTVGFGKESEYYSKGKGNLFKKLNQWDGGSVITSKKLIRQMPGRLIDYEKVEMDRTVRRWLQQ